MDDTQQAQIDTAIEIARRIVEGYLVAVDKASDTDTEATVTIKANYSHYGHKVTLGVQYAETV